MLYLLIVVINEFYSYQHCWETHNLSEVTRYYHLLFVT